MTKKEWLQRATMEVLIRNSPNVINRQQAAKNLVELVVLVANELEQRGGFK